MWVSCRVTAGSESALLMLMRATAGLVSRMISSCFCLLAFSFLGWEAWRFAVVLDQGRLQTAHVVCMYTGYERHDNNPNCIAHVHPVMLLGIVLAAVGGGVEMRVGMGWIDIPVEYAAGRVAIQGWRLSALHPRNRGPPFSAGCQQQGGNQLVQAWASLG